jgi:hypothetical protein
MIVSNDYEARQKGTSKSETGRMYKFKKWNISIKKVKRMSVCL